MADKPTRESMSLEHPQKHHKDIKRKDIPKISSKDVFGRSTKRCLKDILPLTSKGHHSKNDNFATSFWEVSGRSFLIGRARDI